jgi:NAD(P)H-dependent flavin oxidoreductase YrpB (nitropropane dioxygenase family)
VNLLLPFAREAHVKACLEARPDAVVLAFGFWRSAVVRLKAAGIFVLHQIGAPEEAARALADGADAVIAQGRDAGGHLLGTTSARDLLPRVRAVAGGAPVVIAGGIADRGDVASALASGADAVLCGTRFLATEEALAHALYKERVLGAEETIETTLFGLGWPVRHRVLPNEATRRWCRADGRPPLAVRAAQRALTPLTKVFPLGADPSRAQRLSVPLYSPAAPRPDADPRVLEVAPLYAGESARRVRRVVGAEDAVRDLFA